jgi:hypothetical protein
LFPSLFTSYFSFVISLLVYFVCYFTSSIFFYIISKYYSSFNSPYLPFKRSYSFSTTYKAVAPLFSCSSRTRILYYTFRSFYTGLSFSKIIFLLISSLSSSLNFRIISRMFSLTLLNFSIAIPLSF